MTEIAMIAAMAANRVIGHNNAMPWHLKTDLKHFKQITMGKPIIMGRKTYESIGRTLPGRANIIISGDSNYQVPPGAIVCSSLDLALTQVQEQAEAIVIGGAQIYQLALPIAKKIYLTIINHEYAGDTYFPELDSSAWQEIERKDFPAGDEIPFTYSFVTLLRQ